MVQIGAVYVDDEIFKIQNFLSYWDSFSWHYSDKNKKRNFLFTGLFITEE